MQVLFQVKIIIDAWEDLDNTTPAPWRYEFNFKSALSDSNFSLRRKSSGKNMTTFEFCFESLFGKEQLNHDL
jgi:hypothetical protein